MRNQRGFTLIELIISIVIIGILAAVAVPRYLELTSQAADGTAKGILGTLRSQNALKFGKNILGNTSAPYTMLDIATNVAELGGITWTADATKFTMTTGRYVYTFTLNPTPQAPTTFGTIYASTTTW